MYKFGVACHAESILSPLDDKPALFRAGHVPSPDGQIGVSTFYHQI